MAIRLIVGLQNPGESYTQTRHNAGGWYAHQLASWHRVGFRPDSKLQGEMASLEIAKDACRILVPTTFMNHSGRPVRAVSGFYRIMPDEILVAHDELDLPAGRIKLKTGGGHGGHNGLRDIITQLGSADFHRLRIGIGHPGHKDLVLPYVLGKPSVAERQLIDQAIERAIDITPVIVGGDLRLAMNTLNSQE